MNETRTRLMASIVSLAVAASAFAGPATAPATRPAATKAFSFKAKFGEGALRVSLAADAFGELDAGPERTEKAAFLGVGVAPVDATLAAQLDLPRGVGLTVVYVEEGSPAAQAGLQQHDVLKKLDEQLLVNIQQLATLVRTFKPGTEVAVTVIRKGKPQVIGAKLVERDLPMLSAEMSLPTLNGLQLQTAGDLFLTQTDAKATDASAKEWQDAFKNLSVVKDARDAAKENADVDGRGKHVVVEGDPSDASKPRVIRLSPGARTTVARTDEQHSIQLKVADGTKTLTVKDKDGKMLFDGPYTTPEDQSKLPEVLREKVNAMLDGVEFRAVPATAPAEPKAEIEPGAEDGMSV